MKLVFPVGVRHYEHASGSDEENLVIAQTLCDPEVSAAGSSPEEAVTELIRTLRDVLGRLNPRTLWTVWPPARTHVLRRRLPCYTSASYDWFYGNSPRLEETLVWVNTWITVTELPGGVLRVGLPAFGLSTSVRPSEAERPAFFEDFEDDETDHWEPSNPLELALADLLLDVQRASHAIAVHRPIPSQFDTMDVEVEFESLDLTRVRADQLWMEGFDDDAFEDTPAGNRPQTPALERVAQNWSGLSADEAAQRGIASVFERQGLAEELQTLVFGARPAAVVLVGPSRVGKTALVKHLAHLHTGVEEVKHPIWFADPPRMVSTDPMAPGWQQQCKELTQEIEALDGVLFMGRLIETLDAGKYIGSDYNLAQFLKPTLQDQRIRVVAEATVDEWNDIERRDVGFARSFTVIRVDDPNHEIAQKIVHAAATRLGQRFHIVVQDDAIVRAWGLQRRFATEGSPVGRTIDFLSRTLRQAANSLRNAVGVPEIIASFCRDTGLAPLILDDTARLDISEVRQRLTERVLGQEDAVQKVANVVGITKAGLASDDRPLGSFLFVGPTGVGKTELARALATYLFGSPDRLVRLDMSEYAHANAYSRLVGEGKEDGELTGPVKRQPFCVVLLDELEKAHPNVFDLLLQVLGEARLTDVSGRTTRFQNTIIVMTSNLGVETLRPAIGFEQSNPTATYAAHFRKEAERFFRPEFLARIDQFIPFHPLGLQTVEGIARRELNAIRQRDGVRAQDVELHFSDDLVAWLAKRGLSEKYGARPLKRVIDQQIVWKLAKVLSDNPSVDGSSRTLHVELGGPERDAPNFRVEFKAGDSTLASARQVLLKEIDEIAGLRRRLQYYTFSNVFSDLEWEVTHFDASSLSANFWTDPNAAEHAARADRARKIVEPVNDVANELAALEDLANEAFHARTFAISSDLTQRLHELGGRVGKIVVSLLRGAYEDPDHVAVFLVSRSPEDPWREQLVEWYRRRAARHGWKYTLWKPVQDFEDLPRDTDEAYDNERVFWETTDRASGAWVIGMEFEGYAVRPLMRAEDGHQRMVSSDGNGVCDIHVVDSFDGWPFPDVYEDGRSNVEVVRTYNYRTNEVTMPGSPSVRLYPDDPWRVLEPVVEDQVWALTEGDWE